MATTPRDRRRLETIESIAESMIDSSGERLSAMESTVGDLQEVAKTQTKQIATKESYQVLAGKLLVGLVLAGCAACAGYFTYRFMSNQEETEFVRKFEGFADELIAVSETKAVDAFEYLESFGNELTSLAEYGGMQWPFVTVKDYHVRAADYHNLTGALSTTLCPAIPEADREAWMLYVQGHKEWIEAGYEYTNTTGDRDAFVPFLYNFENRALKPVTAPGEVTTVWQSFPVAPALINFQLESSPLFTTPQESAKKARRGVLTELSLADISWFDTPTSIVFEPIFRSFEENADIVAYLSVYLPFSNYFENVLSTDSPPVRCVVSNPCGGNFTLEIFGPQVVFLGHEDLHDPTMEEWGIHNLFAQHSSIYLSDTETGQPKCQHHLHIYPSSEMKADHETVVPLVMTIGAVAVFLFTSLVFLLGDYLVYRQNQKITSTFKKSSEIVNTLFPEGYRDRLFGDGIKEGEFLQKTTVKSSLLSNGRSRRHSVDDSLDFDQDEGPEMYTTAPVADLFPECTVMEADIAGFTAWASVREPVQVFQLLETLYGAFDEIAQRRRVFKVETIGDAYVAVAGLPTPRRDHATVMVRFAYDCLVKMTSLTKELEVDLGPGTSALAMRFGINSGSVTAGVLRGDGLRFQLFGETVNVAEEMEKHGEFNKIHVSEQTAELLREAGKSHWLKTKDQKILVKGKGLVQSYWVFPKSSGDASSTGESSNAFDDSKQMAVNMMGNDVFNDEEERREEFMLDLKTQRMVDWNVQILSKALKQLVAWHQVVPNPESSAKPVSEAALMIGKNGKTCLDEVKDIVSLPQYCAASRATDADSVELSPQVQQQLHTFVYAIASQYNGNPFHNFEHASHVTMSVTKLLSRIIAPVAGNDYTDVEQHDFTYGITSDPLTQFGVVLSALIHDLDHSGVPNAILVNEGTELASKYNNKSVAEQNSVDLAWGMLMSNRYKDLRQCIYTTQAELERFRSIVINVVLATDIADKDLGAGRKARWDKAFKLGDAANHVDENPRDEVNRKATIVIEHLIQASDIAHTMQHWHVYRKWNERLYAEMQKAYVEGRTLGDPAEKWYEGEIGFFDFYIIPLAKKLKDCGVFGVSSAEYLDYALANREEWVRRGREVVDSYEKKYVRLNEEVDV